MLWMRAFTLPVIWMEGTFQCLSGTSPSDPPHLVLVIEQCFGESPQSQLLHVILHAGLHLLGCLHVLLVAGVAPDEGHDHGQALARLQLCSEVEQVQVADVDQLLRPGHRVEYQQLRPISSENTPN
jgi:hypothetical protein